MVANMTTGAASGPHHDLEGLLPARGPDSADPLRQRAAAMDFGERLRQRMDSTIHG